MAQKKRSVTLSPTVFSWLEVLVSTGEYSDLDDAATDLLMQLKRGTTPVLPTIGPKVTQYDPVLTSTTPVLVSTHTESIVVESSKPSSEPPIALTSESPAEELGRLRALKPMERMKYSSRITELKEVLEA